MPFNPGGVFSLVASYFAQPGTTIRTEQHNPVFEDVASALSQALIRDGRAPMTGNLNMNGFKINGAAPGATPGDVATLGQAMPIGAVIDFAGATAPPGWLLCYGQQVSRATYSNLLAVIGTAFGNGNGSTTFNLPDFRGRLAAGKDNMGGSNAGRLNFELSSTTLGASGGSDRTSLAAGNLPSHTHSGTTGSMNRNASHSHGVSGGRYGGTSTAMFNGGDNFQIVNGAALISISSENTNHEHNFNTNGGNGLNGTAFSRTPPVLILNKIIRASYNG